MKIFSYYLLPSILLLESAAKCVPKVKVCVIGAGRSGISVIRHLSEVQGKFEITAFEKSSEVGGQWLYTEETGTDKRGYPVHSSMYENLRANLPKELMGYPDWPEVRGANRSFVPHRVFLEYLKNYTDHFDLRRFIELDTIVEKVTLVGDESWKVAVKNVKTSESSQLVFDKVVVCSGHLSKPRVPAIPGLKDFAGKVLHSHDYRRPDYFRNKSVIILGGGPSGLDIGSDLINLASKLYLSHNNKKLPTGLPQVAGVDRFENGRFVLRDNSSVSADALLLCTGYDYAFPFLDDSSAISIDEGFVSPLFKHVINVEHPSLVFTGIVEAIGNFFSAEAQFIASFFNGKVKLPSKRVMLDDAKLKTPQKKRDAHKVSDPWKWADELARFGQFPPVSDFYKIGFQAFSSFAATHFDDFKDYDLSIAPDHKTMNFVEHRKPELS